MCVGAGVLIASLAKEMEMTGNMSGGIRLKALTNVLAAIAMVGVYFLQTIVVSGLAVTATTTSAEARGRRGRRGRGAAVVAAGAVVVGGPRCPLVLWEAGLCW